MAGKARAGSLKTAVTSAPPVRVATVAVTTRVLYWLQVISFSVPFTNASVAPATAARFDAVTATLAAVPAGAACTEFALTAPAIIAAVNVTPRRLKIFRSFSSARSTRLCTAGSLSFNVRAASAADLFSKNRSSRALRSVSPSRPMAASNSGAICSHFAAAGSCPLDCRYASCSRWCRRNSTFTKLAAVSRAV